MGHIQPSLRTLDLFLTTYIINCSIFLCLFLSVSDSDVHEKKSEGIKRNSKHCISRSLKVASGHQAVCKTWMDRYMLGDSIGLHYEACCVLCPCAGSHTVRP